MIVAALALLLIWYTRDLSFIAGGNGLIVFGDLLIAPIYVLIYGVYFIASGHRTGGMGLLAISLASIVGVALHPIFQKRWAMATTIIGFVMWILCEVFLATLH